MNTLSRKDAKEKASDYTIAGEWQLDEFTADGWPEQPPKRCRGTREGRRPYNGKVFTDSEEKEARKRGLV